MRTEMIRILESSSRMERLPLSLENGLFFWFPRGRVQDDPRVVAHVGSDPIPFAWPASLSSTLWYSVAWPKTPKELVFPLPTPFAVSPVPFSLPPTLFPEQGKHAPDLTH